MPNLPYVEILILLMAIILICLLLSMKNRNALAADVRWVMVSVLVPMIGNIIIACSASEEMGQMGYTLFFIGTNLFFYAMMRFTADYCNYDFNRTKHQYAVLALIVADIISVGTNFITGFVFSLHRVLGPGHNVFFIMHGGTGYVLHMVLSYLLLAIVFGMLIYKIFHVSRLYIEKYVVIFVIFLISVAWESYYMFVVLYYRPIDTSMIGYGICVLLIYYFSLFYSPVMLLGHMSQRVVSDLETGIFFFDSDRKCIYANPNAQRMFHITSLTLDKTVPLLHSLFDYCDEDLYNDFTREVHIGSRNSASERYYHVQYHRLHDKKSRCIGGFFSLTDRTAETKKQNEELFRSRHDSLTHLYNRDYFSELVRQELDDNPDTIYLMTVSDIRDFKLVNDIFGTDVGDGILRQIGATMAQYARKGTIFCRLENDQFALITPKADYDEAFVLEYLNDISHNSGDVSYPLVIHTGVYEITEPDISVSVMIDRAVMAIASVKNEWQSKVAYYDNDLRDNLIREQRLTASLDEAIIEGQIRPYLQPQVNSEGKIVGAEVLARWIHPERGFLSPGEFIPVFEKNGMIAKVDKHMWQCACAILRQWQDEGVDLFLSINISPKDFYFVDIYQTLTDMVSAYGISTKKLRIEITETVMMNNVDNRLELIDKLHAAGFLVEMDDFGSGYSSLNLLKDIPVDVLKIDMAFLNETKEKEKAKSILKSVIELSEQLKIESLCEGVETREQAAMLKAMGCKMFQGYYFSKPIPPEDFRARYLSKN